MGAHINADGEFQSDKYPACPAGKVPLSTKDTDAQSLLWEYAERHEARDAEFSEDLRASLQAHGFKPDPMPVVYLKLLYLAFEMAEPYSEEEETLGAVLSLAEERLGFDDDLPDGENERLQDQALAQNPRIARYLKERALLLAPDGG